MNKRTYNKLYKTIFKDNLINSPLSTYEDLLEYLKDMKYSKPAKNIDMKNEQKKVELYALSCGLMALAINGSQGTIKEEFKNYSTVYYTLLTNISNSCLSVISLLENGFEFQAKIIVRNIIELVYTLLVVIINKTKCKEYFESARLKNEYEVWNKHFRMSKLNEELYLFEKNNDVEFAEMMKKTRKEIYSEYSSFAHNDFICCFVGCNSMDKNNDMVYYNLWGNYNYKATNILSSMNDLLWMMFLYFKNFVAKKCFFDKDDYINKDNYKYWNDSLFISVLLDEEKRKEDKEGV